jgi:hypothetical protein
MKRNMHHKTAVGLAGSALFVAAFALPTVAQEDNLRGVHIIDSPTQTPGPATIVGGFVPTIGLGSLHGKVKIANTADVTLQILSGPEFKAGSKIAFAVKSKKSGYLILVDVDASGKVTQIYPNPISLLHARGLRERSNFITSGHQLNIPDPKDAYAGFEFIATPSKGPSMVVAMLSQRPVQLIDLPDLPPTVTDETAALTYLANVAEGLKIAEHENGTLSSTTWSFDASAYSVKAN